MSSQKPTLHLRGLSLQADLHGRFYHDFNVKVRRKFAQQFHLISESNYLREIELATS